MTNLTTITLPHDAVAHLHHQPRFRPAPLAAGTQVRARDLRNEIWGPGYWFVRLDDGREGTVYLRP